MPIPFTLNRSLDSGNHLPFDAQRELLLIGLLYIVLFGIGHCIPIAIAGSSTAKVRNLLENSSFHQGSQWFRKCAGVTIAIPGIYFVIHPFVGMA
ncbi:MAG: hypothetical protein P4L43_17745 [Syntrophobacteraceae bacterium]|nr:hypothetical protein [Syntrophobacteraceae bacterium]